MVILWLTLPQQNTVAAIVVSQVSGNWSNVSTWGGILPQAGDQVIIASGITVNLNQTSANSLSGLTIQGGAKLLVTQNGSGIHINGNLINNGELTTWFNEGLKGTIFFHGNSYWFGAGIWNLSAIQLNDYSWEFDDHLVISIAGNIDGNASSSFNKINQRANTEFRFSGSENAVLVSDGTKYIYPSIVIDKPSLKTVSMLASASANTVSIIGQITISKSSDVLDLGGFNSLVIDKNIVGDGSFAGSVNSNLLISGLGAEIAPLRFKNQTDFNNITVTRSSGVVFENSFTVLNELFIDANSKITLPSNSMMTIGINGSAPTSGKLICNGLMYTGLSSGLTLRGNDVLPLYLKFSQNLPAHHTLLDLDISRATGAGEVIFASSNSIILDSALNVRANNSLNINGGKLYLNFTITINNTGYITGSDQSELYIQKPGGDATLRFNPNGSESNRSLKYLYLNRTPGRIITIGNTLNIVEEVKVVSGKINGNGFLTLLSTAGKNAGINTLSSSATILGDVNVQAFFTGGDGFRGTRTVSSPINDAGTISTFKQMQSYLHITGSGTGFDAMPLPVSPTIQTYFEAAKYGDGASAQFKSIVSIDEKSLPGTGFFLRFRGNRSDANGNKLVPVNYAYAVPENVMVTFKGPINQGNLTTTVSYTSHTDHLLDAAYNGYNLIGNPYPSTINWALVSKINMEDIVSIIKPGGGMVTYSNGFVTNGGPPNTSTATNTVIPSGLPYIQTGQGFYVKSKPGGGTVNFTESCKNVLSSPDRLLQRPSADMPRLADLAPRKAEIKAQPNAIRIELCDTKNSDETVIVFSECDEAAYAAGDAVYFTGSTVSLASLTSDLQSVAINFMPAIDLVHEVKLKADALTSGPVQLRFTNIFVPQGYIIFLKDDFLHTLTNVRMQPVYHFFIDKTMPATFGTSRFSVIVKRKHAPDPKLNVITASPNPFKENFVIKLKDEIKGNTRMLVFDMQGRKVKDLDFKEGEKLAVDLLGYKSGMYAVELRSAVNGKMLGRIPLIKY